MYGASRSCVGKSYILPKNVLGVLITSYPAIPDNSKLAQPVRIAYKLGLPINRSNYPEIPDNSLAFIAPIK
jgi:hypothetical protein